MSCLGRAPGWLKSQISDHNFIDFIDGDNSSFWTGERHHFLSCLANKNRSIKVWHEAVGVTALVVGVVLAVFTVLTACSVFGGGVMYLGAATLGLCTIACVVVASIALAGSPPPKEESDSDSDSDLSGDSDSD